jgi:hypothetical protein
VRTIIVTGSRNWSNAELLGRVLDLYKPDLLVQGGARGADELALQWATAAGVKCVTVPAEWEKYGKRAGPLRNSVMLQRYPGALVVAFPLPGGSGTLHCMRTALSNGHKVMIVHPSGEWSIVTRLEHL